MDMPSVLLNRAGYHMMGVVFHCTCSLGTMSITNEDKQPAAEKKDVNENEITVEFDLEQTGSTAT